MQIKLLQVRKPMQGSWLASVLKYMAYLHVYWNSWIHLIDRMSESLTMKGFAISQWCLSAFSSPSQKWTRDSSFSLPSYLLLFWLLNFSIFEISTAMSKCGLNMYYSLSRLLCVSPCTRFLNGNFFNYFSNWRSQWHKQPVLSISTPKIAKEEGGEEGDCDDGYILQHTFSQRAPPPPKMGKWNW